MPTFVLDFRNCKFIYLGLASLGYYKSNTCSQMLNSNFFLVSLDILEAEAPHMQELEQFPEFPDICKVRFVREKLILKISRISRQVVSVRI